jgi:LmbE family N-acetylglucosaminyl deacetylase
MATVVFFHAHPDDECIATGGTMAELSDAGHRVVLVTATRGELGEVHSVLDEGEELWQRRTRELDEACRLLGVARQEFLGYRDSGMAGTAANNAPGSFFQADLEEAAGRLAELLAQERPDAFTCYDDHGGYGHPDHVQVHRVGLRAAQLADVPRVLMATQNRDQIQALLARATELGTPIADDAEDVVDVANIGVPEDLITTAVDVGQYLDRKRAAMRAHASQMPPDSFFLAIPDDAFAAAFGTEWYIRLGAEQGVGPLETSVLG